MSKSERPASLGGARSLLGRVADRVREALPHRPRRGSSPPPAAPIPQRAHHDDPILTPTMADRLAAAGHDERALEIYERLLQQTPADPRLTARAARLRQHRESREPRRNENSEAEEVAVVTLEDGSLLVSWNTTETALSRARAWTSHDGILCARTLVVSADASGEVRSAALERRPVRSNGEWVLHPWEDAPIPDGPVRCTAAIGLLYDERFVSIAHSRVIDLTRGAQPGGLPTDNAECREPPGTERT